MRTPVTTDHAVLTVMVEAEYHQFTAKGVGHLLDLTPFQITARLKGMENRGLVTRNGKVSKEGKKLWVVTDAGTEYQKSPPPPPSVSRSRPRRKLIPSNGLSTDIDVPRITRARLSEGWVLKMLEIDGYSTNLFTSPLGTVFIEARSSEPANLIFETQIVGLEPVRLKLYEGSIDQIRRENWSRNRENSMHKMRFK